MESGKIRQGRLKRHRRIRKNLHGTGERPRVAVFRSLKHIYAQVIDDERGVTLLSAASNESAASEKRAGAKGKLATARAVGRLLADRAKEKGVTAVCFDRGGYLYHGRVKALAEGAREGGLQF